IDQGDFKNNRVKCKHCGWEAIKLADRIERHLLNSCEEYKLSEFTMRAKQSQKLQDTLHRVSKSQKQQLDAKAGIAIFSGGLPLNTFDKTSKPDMVEFLYELNNAYTPPAIV